REKRLYADDPLGKQLTPRGADVLRQAVEDLAHPQELRELGLALFLDRPLGAGKDQAEADQTLLLSYEAFSRAIAERRLDYLGEKLGLIPDAECYESLRRSLRTLTVPGVPLPGGVSRARPGTVSIHEAHKVADDSV